MTPAEINELVNLAKRAVAGRNFTWEQIIEIMFRPDTLGQGMPSTKAYLAAASPETIIELLDRTEKAERDNRTKDRQIEALRDRCEAIQAKGFNEKLSRERWER